MSLLPRGKSSQVPLQLFKRGELSDGELKDVSQITLHDFFEVVPRFAETMVSKPVLGKVVSFDLFGAHARANSLRPFVRESTKTLFFL
ncbi:MAG: hypothetical protein UV30_C0030G0010 [Candidatus Collierbacteria bacterium GW2011_GWF1_42_50]|nr:MAG: hypothetical protein UV30_C0030G0010 [Candidatus Collierbacteria bacterium GW2011_GWF1_42_50]